MARLLNEAPGLLAFIRTVEAGSFTAAARDLKTTPSAVSKAVARLENLVGVRLFLRTTRALKLTPDGNLFFARIAPLLREIDESAELLLPSKEPTGRLKMSMPSEIARFLMAPLMTKFANDYPLLQLDIGITDRYVDLVREDYDVVFRVGHVSQGDLIVRRLMDVEMVLVASPSFTSHWGNPQTVAELSKLPFARYVAGRTQTIHFQNGESIVTSGRVDCDSGYGLQVAALEGIGVAHLMHWVVAEDLRAGLWSRFWQMCRCPRYPLTLFTPSKKTYPRGFDCYVTSCVTKRGGHQLIAHLDAEILLHVSCPKPGANGLDKMYSRATRCGCWRGFRILLGPTVRKAGNEVVDQSRPLSDQLLKCLFV